MLSRFGIRIALKPSSNFIMKNLCSDYANVFKVDSEKMKTIVTPELLKLVDIFKDHNYEIKIAGGAVRDLISGEKIPDDIDLATTATPEEMKTMFTKEEIRMINVEGGEKHGTITARIDDKFNFEVTTLRIDKITDGRHAEVEFTKDWQIDAERRDLTVNSMFLNIDGTVVDFFNGRKDLQNKRIAFVGSAEKRIQEDYLRILRYFRFYGRLCELENEHEEETMNAIRKNANGLKNISGERIWTELKKILSGPMAEEMTLKMIELGLAKHIGLPSEPNIQQFLAFWKEKKNTVHYVTLLVQLLSTEEEMADSFKRLRMSSFERDLGYFLIQHRSTGPKDLKFWQKTLLMTKSKTSHVRDWIEQAIICDENSDKILQDFKNWETPTFPVNGMDLKNRAEPVPVGKIMGQCLTMLKLQWIESDFSLDRDKLLGDVLDDVLVKVLDEYDSQPSKRKKKSK